MKTTAISVTEAARNFADCVNRAHYQNVTFVLLRNGSPLPDWCPMNRRSAPAGTWPGFWRKASCRRTKPRHGIVICGRPARPSKLRVINGDNS